MQSSEQGVTGAPLVSKDDRQHVEIGPHLSAASILGRIKDHFTLGTLAAEAVLDRRLVNELALVVNSICFQITDVLFSTQQQHLAGQPAAMRHAQILSAIQIIATVCRMLQSVEIQQ